MVRAKSRSVCCHVEADARIGMVGDTLNTLGSQPNAREDARPRRLAPRRSGVVRSPSPDAGDGPRVLLATLEDRLGDIVAVSTSASGRVARASSGNRGRQRACQQGGHRSLGARPLCVRRARRATVGPGPRSPDRRADHADLHGPQAGDPHKISMSAPAVAASFNPHPSHALRDLA
jgi:hypothetical protein